MQKEKYLELKYFCLQYKDKKREANINSSKGRKAAYEVALIEQLARNTNSEIWTYIVESVSTGKSWEQLNAPCGRRQFYAARNRFFDALSKLK